MNTEDAENLADDRSAKLNDFRTGGWIQTYSGRRVFPLGLTTDDLDLEDIAHALSMKCRFNGHCKEFYSVAQHCVLASRLVEPSAFAKEALMHDAAEYVLPDFSTPVKAWRGDAFKVGEWHADRAIAERYGLLYPRPPEVKVADIRLVLTEKRDLMFDNGDDWSKSFPGFKPYEYFHIRGWAPEYAKRMFLERAEYLEIK